MKILLAYPTRSSFIARDIKILASKHVVSEHSYYSLAPANLLRGIRAVAKADVLFLWFASMRSVPLVLAAVLLRKPILTAVGGYEAANCPDISYGNARFRSQKLLTRWILARSRIILAGSYSSQSEIITNLGIAPERLTLVRYGFDDNAANSAANKADSVLTIGFVSEITWHRKGVFEFVRCAEQLPELQFIHVGSATINVEKRWGRTLPSNLVFKGRLSDEELAAAMATAKVYLQLSRHEAFGCSVAESMLFRCIPIVSNRFSLPEVVGDSGVIVDPDNLEAAAAAIKFAIEAPPAMGQAARDQILSTFPMKLRAAKILAAIDELMPADR